MTFLTDVPKAACYLAMKLLTNGQNCLFTYEQLAAYGLLLPLWGAGPGCFYPYRR
jgi:hypothetical protein